MVQASYAYSQAANDAEVALSLAVFADRPRVLAQLREDAAVGGFHVTSAQAIAVLIDQAVQPLAEVVLVDCPVADGLSLAALSRLDMRVAQSGAQLIVATTMEALDAVFGCIDQSGAQLLVDPGRADYVMALGRAKALSPSGRVRELAEQDRLTLLRLTEQVGEIAARLGQINAEPSRLEAPAIAFRGAPELDGSLIQRARPALPDPRMIRRLVRQRQQRARFFDGELFADPACDMLLDLTAARAENKRVSVTSLCIAAAVPPTTALRWIGMLVSAGLFQRVEDMADRRRAFIELTDKAADGMARYFDALEEGPLRSI
jgi:predicted transcriptional regulator